MKKITKTEVRKIILSDFYNHIETKFGKDWELNFEDNDVIINPIFEGSNFADDGISFRRSTFSLCDYNWSCEKTKEDLVLMENYLLSLINEMETKHNVKFS